MTAKRYPIGIQTFPEIIRGGYYYVDKTDLVWQMANHAKFIFLSRPRRFGKSLLTSTLEAYFKGDRELFEGLKIMDYETEWKQYPVIRLDLSMAKAQANAADLQSTLMWILRPLADKYGRGEDENLPGKLLTGIIRRAYEQTGMQVAVIIDEYDAPLLEVLHEDTMLPEFRRVMQEFYVPLKASEQYIRFCFITGITKFSQLSIFSTINNLKNVTMDPKFAAICGITEEELLNTFQEGIAGLAEYYECSTEEMQRKLKLQYDGYHFTKDSPGIYNPFSLLNAFLDRELTNGWFASGTPTYLIRQMQHFRTDITTMDELEEPAQSFDVPTEAMTTALPLLYQSGYLTIKRYDKYTNLYRLGIPNQEVRVGFTQGLLPTYTGLDIGRTQVGFAVKFWRALQKHDLDLALREMQAYLAGIPYVEGFKKKLAEAANAEGFYEYTFYLIFSMLNVYVRTQVKCAGGRIDMVVWMPDTTYVLELKTTGTAQEALAQIDSHDYALPYQTEGRKVVKAGVKVNPDTRTIEDWAIAQ
ncbi:MAG: ATP-binding protein [Bacteroidaceae bacterium]|nr:ATP-binding protein [Bacteroidaceae bacterium]